jgi:hypothetical protein
MAEIKQLTLDDWPLVEAKINESSIFRIAQTKHEISKQEYLNYTYKSFNKTNEQVYGYFVNNDLISMTSVYTFIDLPGYLMKNFKHFGKANLYNPVTSGMAPTFNKIIEIKEAEGLYTFWMSKTADYRRLNQKRVRHLMFDIGCPKLKNYEITIEEVIPANTKSKYRLHADGIHFGSILSEDTCIIKYTCKQEFRNNVSQELAERVINK